MNNGTRQPKAVIEKEELLTLFTKIRQGEITPEEALLRVQTAPFEDLGYAKIDLHRGARQGVSEVVYGQHKTPGQILGIVSAMRGKGLSNILLTRLSDAAASYLTANGIDLEYHPIPRLGVVCRASTDASVDAPYGSIVVASAGTSDMAVCEEAALTAELFGSRVTRLYDVGVAGLHRLLARLDVLSAARVVIAVAGMEGALASVIGGLVSCPVIAVPTSVGYGANFAGLSALLSMLNSCASGVAVVNIDNGFGAGYIANVINKIRSAQDGGADPSEDQS
ncbi:MAG: nickel pincer cofactor biosynthesis protein LarB [Clostridiales bacterium]|jgi:NCAIR mutase (PurE)-related protein|nr:nickel pincer cofactor biosynthesis protein LarB [Clostridiales bacterium]